MSLPKFRWTNCNLQFEPSQVLDQDKLKEAFDSESFVASPSFDKAVISWFNSLRDEKGFKLLEVKYGEYSWLESPRARSARVPKPYYGAIIGKFRLPRPPIYVPFVGHTESNLSDKFAFRLSSRRGVMQVSGNPEHIEAAYEYALQMIPGMIRSLYEPTVRIRERVILVNATVYLPFALRHGTEYFSDFMGSHENIRFIANNAQWENVISYVKFETEEVTGVVYHSGTVNLCGKTFESVETIISLVHELAAEFQRDRSHLCKPRSPLP